jgi:hypothetical protein
VAIRVFPCARQHAWASRWIDETRRRIAPSEKNLFKGHKSVNVL